MNVHLVDGTYELFRHYYAMPSLRDPDGREVAAVRGVVTSLLGMITAGATHVGVVRRGRDAPLPEQRVDVVDPTARLPGRVAAAGRRPASSGDPRSRG